MQIGHVEVYLENKKSRMALRVLCDTIIIKRLLLKRDILLE